MARAAVKAKQAEKAKAQPAKAAVRRGKRKRSGGGNPNQQLFFVRMRRSAKPMYLILAVLFAATFAFLGVGSGSSGLDQLFSGLNIFHHSGTSISSAQKDAVNHPRDAAAWRKLTTAYETHGDTNLAITALKQYTTLKPKDVTAWTELAGLQMSAAQDLVGQYRNAYESEQLAAPSAPLLPSTTNPIGKALGTNPIEQAAASTLNAQVNDLASRAQGAYADAVSTYKRITTLRPHDANAQFQLAQAAQTAGDTASAVAAYKAYLKLNPNSPNAAQIKQLIKSLGG
jgi:tetratricopeptide (TPR) repeat protein